MSRPQVSPQERADDLNRRADELMDDFALDPPNSIAFLAVYYEDQVEQLRAILKQVCACYQGVGDFDGTGERLSQIMPQITAILGEEE